MKRKVLMKLCVECCMIIMLMLMVTACGDRYIPVNDKTQGGTAQENKQNQQPGESLTETPASNEISPTNEPIREPVDVTIVPTEIPTPLPTKEPEPTPSDMIRQYQEALGDSIPRVIGAYNGRNVYDVEFAHEFDYAFDDAAHQGGDFFLKFDQAVFREMDDGDYLRIAFVLDADYELVNPLLQSEYDAITGNKPGYEEWLTSEDGMQALKKIELSLTETAAAAIRDNEWIYLGEGYDEAISQCRGCRYVMVLTTKAQLVEFIPELNQLLAGNQMPDKQSIDSNSLVYVYPAGIVEMMINDIPVGEQIR